MLGVETENNAAVCLGGLSYQWNFEQKDFSIDPYGFKSFSVQSLPVLNDSSHKPPLKL